MPVNIDLLDDPETVAERAGAAIASRLRALAQGAPAGAKAIALGSASGGTWLLLLLDPDRRKGNALLAGDEATEPVLTAIAAALRDGGVIELWLDRPDDPEPLRRAFESAGWRVSDDPAGLTALNSRSLKGLWASATALVRGKRSG